MKIYQAISSPFAVRVRIAVYAKGLTVEFVSPPDGLGSAAFRKITPLGKVPAMAGNNGRVIGGGEVLNEELQVNFPSQGLLPADRHARAKSCMCVVMTDAYLLSR